MKRRQFLSGSALAGAMGLVPLGVAAWETRAPAAAPRFRVLQLDVASGTYRAPAECSTGECAHAALSLRLDALHPAPGAPVLRSVRLSALFDAPGAPRSPFHVWHYDAAEPARASRGFAFTAGRASMRGFRVDYTLAALALQSEECSVVAGDFALLQPGDYVLVGPRGDGRAVAARALSYSGDAARPLADPGRDFDYLAFRVEPIRAPEFEPFVPAYVEPVITA
jgi:hypothetical protein